MELLNDLVDLGTMEIAGIEAPIRIIPHGVGASFDGVEVTMSIDSIAKLVTFGEMLATIAEERRST